MKTHYLKTWPEYFQKVKSGEKNFEVRENDRDFQVGDILVLREMVPIPQLYTGDELTKKVTYILGEPFAKKGQVIMALGSV